MNRVVDVGEVNAARLVFAKATTLCELSERVQTFVERLGFRYTNLVDFARWRRGPDDKPWLLCTFPMEWVHHYYASNYGGVDPVPRTLVANPDIVIRSRMAPPQDPGQAAIMRAVREEEISYGIEDFIAIPIMRIDVPVGAFFATGPTAVCEGAAGLALAHLAPMLYHRAFQLHEGDTGQSRENARGNLSRREADCLKWAAAGKTTWEIGAILGISEHTVAVHLRHVNRKLNVSSRAQAVAEAMKRHLL